MHCTAGDGRTGFVLTTIKNKFSPYGAMTWEEAIRFMQESYKPSAADENRSTKTRTLLNV